MKAVEKWGQPQARRETASEIFAVLRRGALADFQ